jgi:uncharacterized protein (TIGR02757 family)
MQPTLTARQARRLRPRLDRLIAEQDQTARVASDPVAYPRRYTDTLDQEVAALFASVLAFGRVELFARALDIWFAWLDEGGGPSNRIRNFTVEDAAPLRDLQYRWTRGGDIVLLMLATQRVLQRSGDLQSAFGTDGDLKERLERFVGALRTAALLTAGQLDIEARIYTDLPRGFRHLLAAPSGGSACKRWHMMLRWLVRPDDGVDLGLWTAVQPAELLIPVDTHVLRVAKMVNLTDRKAANWRTAEQITASLRRIDPLDPTRYDFALAHLGISGACAGHHVPDICAACALRDVCQIPGSGRDVLDL